MVILIVLLTLLSCYVGASSMKDEIKVSYFIVLGVIAVLYLLSKLF